MSLIDLRLVYAQAEAPPMPDPSMGAGGGDPLAGIDPSMGGGGDMMAMGMGMPGGGGPGGAPPAPAGPVERQEIGGPLEELGLVLFDYNIQAKAETTAKDADTLAQQIWVAYGGDKTGGIAPGRVGKRKFKEGATEDEIDAEIEATKHSRWERLPEGLNIAQVILGSDDPDQPADENEAFNVLRSVVSGVLLGVAQGLNPVYQKSYGAPATAANVQDWVRLASFYESKKKYITSDIIDRFLCEYIR